MNAEHELVHQAADFLKHRLPLQPEVALVLGWADWRSASGTRW